MKQIVNDVGERARNFYTSSENVSKASDGCYDEIFHVLNVRSQSPSVNTATKLRVSGIDTWSEYRKDGGHKSSS